MTYAVVTFVFMLLVKCAICLLCLQGIPSGSCTNIQKDRTEFSPFSELSQYTVQPAPRPKSLSMVIEENDDDDIFSPKTLPTTTQEIPTEETVKPTPVSPPSNETDQPKGRAINFNMGTHGEENMLNKTMDKAFGEDLSDVSMDNDNDDLGATSITTAKYAYNSSNKTYCIDGGLTYEHGEKIENECNSVCTCSNGKMDCQERCSQPFFRKGKKITDPLCEAHDVDDPCCSILVCSSRSDTKVVKTCLHQDKTYHEDDKIENDCDSVCTCGSDGNFVCKPRCVAINKTSERCVVVPDPLDSCCKKVLCDVTLNDHEPEKETDDPFKFKLLTAKYVNSSTIKLEFDGDLDSNFSLPEVELSENRMFWTNGKTVPGGYLKDVEINAHYVKLKSGDDIIEIHNVPVPEISDDKNCMYKGHVLKVGEEYNDNCTSLCRCRKNGIVCVTLECPTYFGVDVLNPNCIDWETVPPDFVPTPPQCCPETVKCKNTGSCVYKNETYSNWQQIPLNVTGCEKRCYCEMGSVECQNVCPPVTALPPEHLECSPHRATLDHLPDDDCCLVWTCKTTDNSPEGEIFNKTNNENMKKDLIEPFVDPLQVNSTKLPSKILGPLLVYTNKETDNSKKNLVTEKPPDFKLMPNLSLEENHYFANKGNQHDHPKTSNPSFNKIPPIHKDLENMKNHLNSPPYLGPLNPSHYPSFTTNKPSPKLPSKVKQNKPIGPPRIQEEQYQFPLAYPSNPPSNQPEQNNHHIEIHGKGDPEELLQFIHQHPELANYPSGSVLEIQDVGGSNRPPKPNIPQRVNPNMLTAHANNKPLVPYLPHDNLPSHLNLDHLLQHIQKNPQQPFNPYIPNQIPINNGQLVFTSPNGLIIPTRQEQNLTHPGNNEGLFPGGFFPPPNFHHNQDEIIVHTLEAIDAHTIRLAFNVPQVLVGLHGRVEVRYTYKNDNDQNNWETQIFAPPNDLIETPHLEFDLLGLKEDTEYKIKIMISLRDLHNTPTSRVYNVRTLKASSLTTLPPMIPIEPNLVVTDINATWLNFGWRKFSDYELQFIDGVQIRYREIDGKIYAATPLIHRAVTSYTLENLKPNTKYEAGIFFIPFSGQQTELHAEHMIHFTTANELDNYGFGVTLEISHVKATSVEITWSGVPYPEDKYVNIYRAIYQSDSGKGDFSTFKIAKRDSPPKTIIADLKPGVRYRLWLEVYLTNGKIKTSNVQDFVTKPRSGAPSVGASTLQGKLESNDFSEHKGDYYGPLVIVAILAAIAILSTLILLLILVKRHNQNKASITSPPRISQSAYDNPSYKVEIQQETMNL